jgi:anti-sigma factor RsiW
MSGPACRDIRLALGVYVVGAIDPTERTIVDVHLSHCPACREELAGLAGLPALLGRVPVGDAERLALDDAELKDLEEPSVKLLGSLLDQVTARRKIRRWRTITAAAAAAVIAVGSGMAGGVAVSGSLNHAALGRPAGEPEFVHNVNRRAHIVGDVSYAPAASGVTMAVRVTGIAPGTNCQFWVVRSDGQRVLAGAWTVAYGQRAGYWPASAPVAPAKIASFLVTSQGKTLVKIPVS